MTQASSGFANSSTSSAFPLRACGRAVGDRPLELAEGGTTAAPRCPHQTSDLPRWASGSSQPRHRSLGSVDLPTPTSSPFPRRWSFAEHFSRISAPNSASERAGPGQGRASASAVRFPETLRSPKETPRACAPADRACERPCLLRTPHWDGRECVEPAEWEPHRLSKHREPCSPRKQTLWLAGQPLLSW